MVDARKYRARGTRPVTTTKTQETFTVHRMSPLRLVEIFAEAGIKVEAGKKLDIDPLEGIIIAAKILPECVDEVVVEGDEDDEHLTLHELDLDDAMELFGVAIELSGVSEQEVAAAEKFRGRPDGPAGGPGGEGLPGVRVADGPPEATDA